MSGDPSIAYDMRSLSGKGTQGDTSRLTRGQRGIEPALLPAPNIWDTILDGATAIVSGAQLAAAFYDNQPFLIAGLSSGVLGKVAVNNLSDAKVRMANVLGSSAFFAFLFEQSFYEGLIAGLKAEFESLRKLVTLETFEEWQEFVTSGKLVAVLGQGVSELTGTRERAFAFGEVLGEGLVSDVIDVLDDPDYSRTARMIGEFLGPLLLELVIAMGSAGAGLAFKGARTLATKLLGEGPELMGEILVRGKSMLQRIDPAAFPGTGPAMPSKASGALNHADPNWAPPGEKPVPPADFPKPDTPAALPHASATTQPPAALTDPAPLAPPIPKADKGLDGGVISRLSRGLEPAPLPTRRPELHELFATLAPDQWAGLQPWQARSVVATFDDVPKLTADAGTLRELIKIYRSWQPGRPEMNAIAATGELAILHRLARSKVVSKIRMIVSGSGQRTPDYACILADDTEITIEVRTLTGTGKVLQGSARPRVFDEAMSHERFLVEFPKTDATQDRIREAIRDKIRHDQIGAFNSQGYLALVVDQATDAGLLDAEFQDSIRQMLAGRPHILGVRILIGDTVDEFIPIDNPSVSFNHPF